MNRDLEYEKNNRIIDCQNPEGGIKCKNFEVCSGVLPIWWYDCKASYLCTNCHMFELFTGHIKFQEDVECPICFETARGVVWPRCNHSTCISCYKRAFHGDETKYAELWPWFPYPEIEDEYWRTTDDPKWQTQEYSKINSYHKENDRLYDMMEEEYRSEKNLRVCPLCRK